MSSHPAAALVERQMRNWELARAQRPGPVPERPEVEEFLCLSRMVGIDSKRITDELGRKLRWPVFDREILDAMAGDDFHRKRIYEMMDESDVKWSGQVIHTFFDQRVVVNDYFHRLCETLLLLARRGHAVFVGRGADLILPSDYGFRVRLTASLDWRAAKLAEARKIEETVARAEIERVEHERGEYFGHHFKLEANDPARYDVTINLERFTPDQVVETILAARRIRQRY